MCGTDQIFQNSHNKTNVYSTRNYEQTEVSGCLLSCGADVFVFRSAIQIKSEDTQKYIFFLFFHMGMKLGHSH
jgi:hypothetical protein